MVCSLPASALFQPALPTAWRCRTNVMIRVSSRRKCVWQSITNCLLSASARSFAIPGVCASAAFTS